MPRRLRLTLYPRKGGRGKVKTKLKAKVQGAPASDGAEWHTDEEDAMFQDLGKESSLPGRKEMQICVIYSEKDIKMG